MPRSNTHPYLLILAAVPLLGLNCLGTIPGTGFPKSVDWTRRTVNMGAAVRPSVVATSDLDMDGRLDVIGGYPGTDSTTAVVYVFFQETVDNFTAVLIATTTNLTGLSALVVGDLDGDTHLDIVAACNGRLVYLHSAVDPRDPAGWTQSSIDGSTGGAEIAQWNDVVIGNIDGANGPDIVACNGGTPGRVSWFRSPSAGITTGTGWTRIEIDMAERTGASSVALADFSGDGRFDVVSTAQGESTERIAWYQNPTDPVAGAWAKHAVGNLTSATRVEIADLDADGRNDVIGLNGPGRQIGWYMRPADATTAWSGFLLTQYTSNTPVDVKATDINADGQIDVVAATRTAGSLRWFIPNPGDTQTAQWLENNIRDVTETIGRIALGDIDGDGRPDVVAPLLGATTAADSIAWFENPE